MELSVLSKIQMCTCSLNIAALLAGRTESSCSE